MDYAELEQHMELFDALLGPEQAKNREIRFDYNVGRDARPDSLRPGREFIQVQITTRNAYFNPVKFSWFYHSVPDRSGWFMTSLSFRAMWLKYLNVNMLDKLKNLEYLDLQGNRLQEINFDQFHEKPHLHTLNLSSNQIRSMNYDFHGLFPMLRILNLHDNHLTNFNCANLSYNIELNRLILSSNQIRAIDLSAIGQLSHLFTIDLSENMLTSIDVELDNPDLTTLLLSNNQITDFTVNGYLIKLRYLALFENNLAEIDIEAIANVMPNLRRLHLWGNKLKIIDLRNCEFNELEELNISGNQLESFYLGTSCHKLQTLKLSYNKLQSFSIPHDCQYLEYIDLRYNPIEELDISSLPASVQEIDLAGTQLQSLSFDEDVEIKNNKRHLEIVCSEITVRVPKKCKINY